MSKPSLEDILKMLLEAEDDCDCDECDCEPEDNKQELLNEFAALATAYDECPNAGERRKALSFMLCSIYRELIGLIDALGIGIATKPCKCDKCDCKNCKCKKEK